MQFRSQINVATAPMDRIHARLERVLDETCRALPYGGDHELRAFIARKLADSALIGHVLLGELGIVARKALADYQQEQQFEPG